VSEPKATPAVLVRGGYCESSIIVAREGHDVDMPFSVTVCQAGKPSSMAKIWLNPSQMAQLSRAFGPLMEHYEAAAEERERNRCVTSALNRFESRLKELEERRK